MSLRPFILFIACILGISANAQNKILIVQGTSPNIYLAHTVAPKENYYSIGRMYNISPKDQIAPYNKLEMEKGLSPGQTIKIPLIGGNFVQGEAAASDEVLIPVYHTVAEKEGLYRVSVNYNKVPIETLKQWNKLKADAVSNGTKLIVGYLKVKTALSPLAGMSTTVPAEAPQVKVTKPVKEPVETPTVKTAEKPLVIKTVEKEKPAAVEPEKKVQPKVEEVAKTADPGKFNGGVFKTQYDEKGEMQKESGSANIFKSTSGWNDGKYYCLHNTAQAGTIIKITSNTTGKSVYAKVLDVMPDIKQNAGILIRISNAAAQDLGVGDSKFDCSLSYAK